MRVLAGEDVCGVEEMGQNLLLGWCKLCFDTSGFFSAAMEYNRVPLQKK
jgi:hypothetical protein